MSKQIRGIEYINGNRCRLNPQALPGVKRTVIRRFAKIKTFSSEEKLTKWISERKTK